MSAPLIVLLALTLAALIALSIASLRMSAQLREMQAQWLKDENAQRELHAQNTKTLEAKLSLNSEQSLSEERSIQQRIDKLSDSISSMASVLSETKTELRALPLRDDKARIGELTQRAEALAAEHRTALSAMEKMLQSARETAEIRARDLAHAKGELSRVEAEIKAHNDASRNTGAVLDTVRNALRESESRAARFEKQLLEITSATRLDKQLLERLGAAEERLNTLTDSLRKAESDVWTERTAKESMGLEARAVRDDMKRLAMKLNDETQKREALEKWAAEANVKLAESPSGGDASSGAQGPESKALLPLPPVLPSQSDITASAQPRSIRPIKPSQAALAATAKKAREDEPKRIASWWCSICGRGGTNTATACKHEWKRNERGEMT